VSPRARFWAGAIFLFLFALGYRVLFLRYSGFDGLYGQDPYAYYDYLVSLHAALSRGEAPPPFHWPLGYPMLALLFSIVLGPTALACQSAAVFSGAMCAPLMYALVLQCRREAWLPAIAAGILLSCSNYALSMSVATMSDLPGLMWALLAAIAMLRYCEGMRVRWLALAAFALAAALLTRWVYALLVVPLGLAALTAYFQRRAPVRTVALHAAVAVAVGGAVMLAHFAPSLLRGDAEVAYAGNLRGYTWSPSNFFKTEFDDIDGHMTWPQPPAEFYLFPLRDWRYVGPVFAPLLLIGVFMLRRAPRPAAVLLVTWAVVFYLFFAGVYMQNNRFPLAYLPPLFAILALGLAGAMDWLTTRRVALVAAVVVGAWLAAQSELNWTMLAVSLGLLALGVAWPAQARCALAAVVLIAAVPYARQSIRDVHYTHTTVIPREIAHAKWAAALVPEDRVLLASGNSVILSHNAPHTVIDLFNLTVEERDAIIARDGEVYLALDPVFLAKQWTGRRPMEHFTWFREHTQFTEIAAREHYRLYHAVAWAAP
jgi:4-amino-4-deoxy-L-arabinose transferase-like glycosyltransferase